DHPDLGAAQLPAAALRERCELLALESDRAGDARLGRQQPGDRERGHALAGPRLAGDPDPAAAGDVERGAADGVDGRAPGRERHGQVTDLEQRLVDAQLRCGSRMSRSPSPTRLKPNAAIVIASPGYNISCGAL